jgi:hypothetical protein
MAHGAGGRRRHPGGTPSGLIDTLAVAALCGLPVQRLVEGDAVERELYLRVAQRSAALHVQMMKAQAAYIAQQVSLLFRR